MIVIDHRVLGFLNFGKVLELIYSGRSIEDTRFSLKMQILIQ